MEKNKNGKIKGILKYIVKTMSLTLLIVVIVFGLALLFVFITTKIAKSKNAEPPINLYTIISPSMTPNINVYDVVVSVKTDTSTLKVGDVISYYSDNPAVNGMTITHRITEVNQNGEIYTFKTKGDYNKYQDEWIVYEKDVVGKVYFKIPQLGRVQFFLGSKGGWILAILIPALGIIAYDIYKIIKLILVKQKLIAYQQKEDLPTNNSNTITTVSELNKEEALEIKAIEPSNEHLKTQNNEFESPKKEQADIVNIFEDGKIDDINLQEFDKQREFLDNWKSNIDEENKKN